MLILKKIGLSFFLIAFVIFNLSLFITEFYITESSITKSGLSYEQQESLLKFAPKISGKNYSKIGLHNKLNNAINKVNSDFKSQKKYDSIIYSKQDIILSIAKLSSKGRVIDNPRLFLFIIFILGTIGALLYYIPNIWLTEKGINNNNIFFNPLYGRKWASYFLFIYLMVFYVILYFYPVFIVEPVLMTDSFSILISGSPSGKWFLYGLLYSIFVFTMGIRFIVKYRHNRYHLIRTISVIFFQLFFAFLIPNILTLFQYPYMDFKHIWPLDYTFFYQYRIDSYLGAGQAGYTMLIWGIILIILVVPLMTYFFGKRWYCSWVCGCGGLAETVGDPFRHLSDKSIKAWKFERYSIYSVLLFAIIMTIATLYTVFTEKYEFMGIQSYKIQNIYGFLIGSVLAGVVGTAFYPIMGNRVWCRYFCPLAAYLGIIQRFKSRFRITTNGGQCMSCGNCSTYCEMGIDVRAYAQKGQNIVRASCVGCGICAAVCPRGVLRLENGPPKGRIKKNPKLTGNSN